MSIAVRFCKSAKTPIITIIDIIGALLIAWSVINLIDSTLIPALALEVNHAVLVFIIAWCVVSFTTMLDKWCAKRLSVSV